MTTFGGTRDRAILIGKVSGEIVIAKVSGEVVKISGEIITAKISGETVSTETPTEVKTGATRAITASSGGEVLHSGAIKAALVKALSLNSGDMYLGGATNRPYSGFGFVLAAGESESMNIDNFSRIYLAATVSGDKVSFKGVS